MSPKNYQLLDEKSKEIITSLYFSTMASLDGIQVEFAQLIASPEEVYNLSRNTPHAAINYLHSVNDAIFRTRIIQSYYNMLMDLIKFLKMAKNESISLVFERSLSILQNDFSLELSESINEIMKDVSTQELALETIDKIDESLPIEEGTLLIDEYAFRNRKDIPSLFIPSSVESIHCKAFVDFYGKYRVDIQNPQYSSINGLLYNKDKTMLLRVPINEGIEAHSSALAVRTIGKFAFQGSLQLMYIDVGDNVERIEDYAFLDNVDMKELRISNQVVYIGHNILNGCSNLRIVYCDIIDLTKLEIESDAFNQIDFDGIDLIVPPSTVDKYKRHEVWSKFTNIMPNSFMLDKNPEYELLNDFQTNDNGSICTVYHGYENVSGHWRKGHWRNGTWVTSHYVSSHRRRR